MAKITPGRTVGGAAASIAFYRGFADDNDLRLFSSSFREQLARELRNADDVALIEAACTIGRYADRHHHRALHKAVLRLLRQRGVTIRKGGHRPEMVSFVRSTARLLECLGWSIKSGEQATATRLLRLIASELKLTGDPRGELRRIAREKRATAAAVDALLARVFQHLAPP